MRGVNVFPTAIEDIVRSHPGATGDYLIIVDDSLQDATTGFLTGLKLQVEAAAPGSLPRSVHKAKRLVRG